MGAAFSSKTSANVHQTTRRHITGASSFRSHCHEKVKPEIIIIVIIVIIIIIQCAAQSRILEFRICSGAQKGSSPLV